LVEIDSVRNTNYKEKYSDWPPAGKNWRQQIKEEYVEGIVGATIAADKPIELAELWSEVLDSELITKKDTPYIILENANIKFVQSKNDYIDLVGIEIKASQKRLDMGKKINILGLDINFV